MKTVMFAAFMFSSVTVWARDSQQLSAQEKLMQTRAAFSTGTFKRFGENGIRYTVTYTGPDRHYELIRFGLYPETGQAHAYSVLSGRLYRGRQYPVSFICKKLASGAPGNFRLLLDRVEYR